MLRIPVCLAFLVIFYYAFYDVFLAGKRASLIGFCLGVGSRPVLGVPGGKGDRARVLFVAVYCGLRSNACGFLVFVLVSCLFYPCLIVSCFCCFSFRYRRRFSTYKKIFIRFIIITICAFFIDAMPFFVSAAVINYNTTGYILLTGKRASLIGFCLGVGGGPLFWVIGGKNDRARVFFVAVYCNC